MGNAMCFLIGEWSRHLHGTDGLKGWGLIAHWIMAVFLLAMIPLGIWMGWEA